MSGCSAPQPPADGDPRSLTAPPSETVPFAVPVPSVPVSPSPLPPVSQDSGPSGLETRVKALESSMTGVQAEVAAARPALRKIAAIEGGFRALSLELDRIDREYGTFRPSSVSAPVPMKGEAKPAPAAASSPPAKKTETEAETVSPSSSPSIRRTHVPQPVFRPAPQAKVPQGNKPASVGSLSPAAGSSPAVRNLRVGSKDGGVTRIVLDTSAPTRINYDLDNAERILVVEVPSATWATRVSGSLDSSPLVSSYSAQSDAQGSRLILQLKAPARVAQVERLPADGGGPDRVYLDLVPQGGK